MSRAFQEEEALGKAYDARLMRRLWSYVAPYGWQVVATLAMVVPMFLLELAPAWIIKNGLDRVVGPAQTAAGAVAHQPGAPRVPLRAASRDPAARLARDALPARDAHERGSPVLRTRC